MVGLGFGRGISLRQIGGDLLLLVLRHLGYDFDLFLFDISFV